MTGTPPTTSGLLIVTHGRLAEELVETVRRLEGDAPDTEAVCLGWGQDVADSARRIEEATHRLRERCGSVLILTDMFGGGATDLALSLQESGAVEVATGVNLPMVMKFRQLRAQYEFPEAVRRTADQGRSSIQVAGDLLRKPGAGEGT